MAGSPSNWTPTQWGPAWLPFSWWLYDKGLCPPSQQHSCQTYRGHCTPLHALGTLGGPCTPWPLRQLGGATAPPGLRGGPSPRSSRGRAISSCRLAAIPPCGVSHPSGWSRGKKKPIYLPLFFYITFYSPLPLLEVPGSVLGRFSGGLSRSLAATPSMIASKVRLPNCKGSPLSSSDILPDSGG